MNKWKAMVHADCIVSGMFPDEWDEEQVKESMRERTYSGNLGPVRVKYLQRDNDDE